MRWTQRFGVAVGRLDLGGADGDEAQCHVLAGRQLERLDVGRALGGECRTDELDLGERLVLGERQQLVDRLGDVVVDPEHHHLVDLGTVVGEHERRAPGRHRGRQAHERVLDR